MSNTQEFLFTREEIEQQINALYDLDDAIVDARAEGENPSAYDDKAQQLRNYFESLADSLWAAGAFKSRDEARKFIKADVDVLQHAGGPGGLRPDDGQLNPDEMAEGIVALRNLNEFVFQAPLCFLPRADVEYRTTVVGEAKFRVTSNYGDLFLVKAHPELKGEEGVLDHVWVECSVKSHRYDVARSEIDAFLVSTMGIMEVLGLARYVAWPLPGGKLSIGIRNYINSGQYLDLHSVRISQHLIGIGDPVATNDVDEFRTSRDRLETNFRILGRALGDSSPGASAARQACRMYVRSYETWNVGEAAMYLAITMEGLLLDKRQKDDLSARLQDSVAYWLGGPSDERQKHRRLISELYKARSNYVHNGEDVSSAFDINGVRDLARRVIRKELLTLGV